MTKKRKLTRQELRVMAEDKSQILRLLAERHGVEVEVIDTPTVDDGPIAWPQKWQPIETAPKDTEVLVFCPGYQGRYQFVPPVLFLGQLSTFSGDPAEPAEPYWTFERDEHWYPHTPPPTHWHPLPEPPEEN